MFILPLAFLPVVFQSNKSLTMSNNIERRMFKGDLSSYLYNHKEFYTQLGDHVVENENYLSIIKPHLQNWTISRRSVWYLVKPPGVEVIRYGFKIHLSFTSELALKGIEKVMPVLKEFKTAFKLLVDEQMLNYFNSQRSSKTSTGKFMTIYPESEARFKELIEELHKVTDGFYGPYILTDKPYKKSQCLFYRYGAFAGNKSINAFGERNPSVVTDDGQTDQRVPYFLLPNGINDPFETSEAETSSSLLNDCYEVTDVLSDSSTKGGVYQAIDTQTGEEVILKEARPYINQGERERKDTIAGLQHEEWILNRLKETGVVPKVIDSFFEWKHYFLVLEKLDYCSLNLYGDWEKYSTINKPESTEEERKVFLNRLLKVMKNLIEAVEKIHAVGIVIGDIAPQNILYHTNTLEVRLIDFEGALDLKEGRFYNTIITPGFTSDSYQRPSYHSDWNAVSSIGFHLLFPVCHLFALLPRTRLSYLNALVRDHQLPNKLTNLIDEIRLGGTKALKIIDQLMEELATDTFPHEVNVNKLSDVELEDKITKIARGILATRKYSLSGVAFPADYRVHNNAKLSAAYGSMGITHFLYTIGNEEYKNISEEAIDELCLAELEQYPTGLFTGISGIAAILAEQGYKMEAFTVLEGAFNSAVKNNQADLFWGLAGIGLASLQVYKRLNLPSSLAKAQQVATVLSQQMIMNKAKEEAYIQNHKEVMYSGLLHGNSGIALFFLRLYEETNDLSDLTKAVQLFQFDWNRREYDREKVAWRRNYKEKVRYPYLRIGAAGIGIVALRFYQVLQEKKYLDIAIEIAVSLQSKYCLQVGQLMGFAGIGEFFLDIFNATQDEIYLNEAHAIARKILLYQSEKTGGILFPGEELLRLSTDYGTGAAGVGAFLLSLQKRGKRKLLFVDLEEPKEWEKGSKEQELNYEIG